MIEEERSRKGLKKKFRCEKRLENRRYPGDTEALEMGNEAMENNKAELEK